jgi:glutathione S-transferase
MYTLYYSPGACSMAIHALLNELSVPFKTENVSIREGKNRNQEFLSLNPRGQVPVLTDGNLVIREGAAILLHLSEKHPNALLAKSGVERTQQLEWLAFANATMHPSYSRAFFLMRNAKDPAKEELLALTYKHIQNLWNEVEQQLGKHPYICGQNLSLADILLTVIANWTLPQPMQFGTHTKALFKAISQRPSYQKALLEEGGTYQAA